MLVAFLLKETFLLFVLEVYSAFCDFSFGCVSGLCYFCCFLHKYFLKCHFIHTSAIKEREKGMKFL